ncbi:MAG: BrnT family toxin [Anaerolineae bacterium]|jgi:hypothetical protein
MKFAWDETKRQTNLAKHGLDFTEAESVFRGVMFSFEDDRFEYAEHRFITIGLLRSTAVVIAHKEQKDVIRSFSMRRATGNEQHLYYRAFAEEWGEE